MISFNEIKIDEVLPVYSSGFSFFSRARPASSRTSVAIAEIDLASAFRTIGVIEGSKQSYVEDSGDWFMDYRNADGSVAEMCGNGTRVFAAYLRREGLEEVDEFEIATRGGVTGIRIEGEVIATNMGRWRRTHPRLDGRRAGRSAAGAGASRLASWPFGCIHFSGFFFRNSLMFKTRGKFRQAP